MAKPFPDMPYWGTFPANGPIPPGKVSDPKTYKKHPWSTGPYMIKSFSPSKELVLEKNPYWDASTDPARTQYPDGYDFKLQQPSEKIDQIMLADTGTGQTTLTYDDLLAPDFQQMKQKAPDRLTLGGSPCTYYWAPDNRKITNKKVREALSWAYPYKNAILAAGLIPGVNAIPATNLMPPGCPGPYAVQRDRAQGVPDRPGQGQGAAEVGQRHGVRDQVPVPHRRPGQREGARTRSSRALTEAGFKATPVPTTTANYPTARDNTSEDINVRSAGWCSDWPSGVDLAAAAPRFDQPGQDPLVRRQLLGVRQQVRGRPDGRRSRRLPLDQQAAAWNALDKEIAHEVLPAVHDRTTAASPRPTGRRSRATSTTTRSACRPGRTSGSPPRSLDVSSPYAAGPPQGSATVVTTRVPTMTSSETQIGMSGAQSMGSPPLMNGSSFSCSACSTSLTPMKREQERQPVARGRPAASAGRRSGSTAGADPSARRCSR